MWQYFIIFVGSVNFHCIECFFHQLYGSQKQDFEHTCIQTAISMSH